MPALGSFVRALLACIAFVAFRGGAHAREAESRPSKELAQSLLSGELGFKKLALIQRHAINPSHVYTYHCEGFEPGGGLYLLALDASEGGGALEELVASPEGQLLDCDLTHDGRELLFSWRLEKAAGYQVFRIGVDGSGLTRLTGPEDHNFNACWLPDGGIAFLSTRKPAFAYCWTSPVGILHRMERDGSGVRRISANYLNDFTPAVLEDGRVIYGRWEYVDRPAIPIQSLWTVYPDGSHLQVYFGNRVLSPATFMEPRAIPGSEKVLCTLTAHNGPCRGAIGVIDPARGPNAQGGILNLTPEVDIGKVNRGDGNSVRGPYESPFPLGGDLFLASRSGTVILRDFKGQREVVVIEPRAGMGFYNAQPIRPQRVPPLLAPPAPDAAASEWATAFVSDVYDGLEPAVQRGEVKRICVVQEVEKSRFADVKRRVFGFQFPVVSCGATYAPKKVWGFADVEADGSASFRVPASVPIYFLALDAEGRAVQRMRSFTHLVPQEVRGCPGCHGSRDRAPHATRGSPPTALSRAPQELTSPEWGLEGFSYPRIVQPVLDRHCARCHNALEAGGGVDLGGDLTDFFNVSYEVLARQDTVAEDPEVGGVASLDAVGRNPYTSWIPTYNGAEADILAVDPRTWGSPSSRLANLVLAGHPDDEGKPRVRLDAAERQRILTWIDLNVPYYGTSSSTRPDRPGCRRLLPERLEETLQEVAGRRCVSCHGLDPNGKARLPRKFYLRITNAAWNSFLLAPLARASGGTGTCSQPPFATVQDPDYQAILRTFEAIGDGLQENPREDCLAAQVENASR